MKKKRIIYIAAAVVLAVLLGWLYKGLASPTRIATLNFPDFTVEKFIRSNNNKFVKIESVDLEDAAKISKYDMVLVRVHGASMDQSHLDAIEKAISKGIPVYSTESDNPKINSFKGRELEYIATLMDNGSIKNYQSLFNYIRKKVDRKKVFNKAYDEPVIIPADYFFHLGDDEFFATYEEYQKFYEASGHYHKDAPRVVVLSGNINMQNSNEEHMAAIINSLEKKGLNVYPVNSFGTKKLEMIAAVKPNIIVNRPHGRLVMGAGESGTELLKQLNVPVLAPVTISELYDKWVDNKQGMESGSMTSMSVVMPELDGAIAPFAVAAQFERGGMNIFDAIPRHTERFCDMVYNYTKLQTKPNSDKKIAIYYYKRTGKGSIQASGIEGVQSLYNTLKMLKDNGYDVAGLPADAKTLEAMIQKQGAVLGTYALGAYDEFIKNGDPALVDVETFDTWTKATLPQKLIDDMKNKYGEAPGEYMGVEKDGKKYIAVARLTFGNVTILPQPLPSVGDNVEKLVHGVDGAPTYPYVASYLWTRNAFKADALVHFGTHGSLEFIPGKQVALSDYDWSDVLVGDMPHFYIYTISNIGEGIIAKRRTYATLISHMTSPFMQSELYSDLKKLDDNVHKIEQLEEGAIKENYRATITKQAQAQNILSALSIDSTKMVSDADIERIHMYIEEINGAKVSDGLYTLGEPYSSENIMNTTRLMSIDPVRYSLAAIDAEHGRIVADKLDDLTFIANRYNQRAENIISRALKGESPEAIFKGQVSQADAQLLAQHTQDEQMKAAMMEEMMKMMTAEKPKQVSKFLDDKGNIIDTDKDISQMSAREKMEFASTLLANDEKAKGMSGMEKMAYAKKLLEKMEREGTDIKKLSEAQPKKSSTGGSMMDRMASAEPVAMSDEKQNANASLIIALQTLQDAINGVIDSRNNLSNSTHYEQLALIDGLNGGYIEPSSAGDPIVNPKAVPTGRNFYSINPETTPSPEAWKVGRRLAENLLEAELKAKGKYPEKVSFTLWSTDFISSEGATVAQILYLLGVEPLRDGFGYIRSLRLIPAEKLGRPRIDVVVQTSGQLRDIAASRLALINRAVAIAAEDKSGDNYVRKGLEDAERRLLEKGFSPADARKYSKERIFGGVNGSYGTGITGMVEKGDSWESVDQIASQYINNMGAIYSSNGAEDWGAMREGVFEAALLNTSVVVQPRSSNTWGALSLDHVYEFMGGMSAAVQHVTGNDPTAYFNDFRNSNRAKVQELKEAIGVETNSTIFNPKYIREMMKGEASAMDGFAETFRNTYGWNVMKPSAIDQHTWNKYYDVYVKDSYNLGLEKTFTEKNPYALQEMTAVMLESARKGMWQASEAQIKDVAELHTKLIAEKSAGCSGFICDNAKLRQYISEHIDKGTAEKYQKNINIARQVQINESSSDKSVVLKKDEQQKQQAQQNQQMQEESKRGNRTIIYIIAALCLAIGIWIIVRRKRQ